MDNECSKLLKNFLTHEQQVDIQLVEPYIHKINTAEWAIQMFKNHLIARLCIIDDHFPMKLWDKFSNKPKSP